MAFATHVHQLQLVWSWQLETGLSQQAPLVYDGVMFIPSPGNVVHAVDAVTESRGGRGSSGQTGRATRRKISDTEVAVITRQFGTLLGSGLTVEHALNALRPILAEVLGKPELLVRLADEFRRLHRYES